MGLGPNAIKLNLELWQRGYFKNKESVLDIGSQELHMTKEDFGNLARVAGISDYKEGSFKNLEHFPAQPRCSAKLFYEMLGLKKYNCIDMNGEWEAINHDLNTPLEDESFHNKYDVVTDYGCNEHIFNVVEAYRTMYRLCKSDGLMIIDQGVFGGNGYFLFDLSFFEGIAAANNLKILFSSYSVTLKTLTKSGTVDQFLIPAQRELLEAIDLAKVSSIGVCYVLQKQSEDDFRIPYQDTYMSHAYGHQGYKLQFLPNPPSRTYVPMQRSVLDITRTKDLIKVIGDRILKRFRIKKS